MSDVFKIKELDYVGNRSTNVRCVLIDEKGFKFHKITKTFRDYIDILVPVQTKVLTFEFSYWDYAVTTIERNVAIYKLKKKG